MNDKKNIDRFFQEKFKNFEAEPSEMVWKNIEANLKQTKKKRRIIPFWLKLSGIASALLIGIFCVNNYFEKNGDVNKIVLEGKSLNNENKNQDSSTLKNNENSKIENKIVINYETTKSDNEIVQKENVLLKTKVENSQNHTIHKNQNVNKTIKSNSSFKKLKNELYTLNGNKKTEKEFKNQENNKFDENQVTESKINSDNELPNNAISTNSLIENNNQLTQNITDEKLGNKKLDAVTKSETLPNALEELLEKNEKEKKKIAKTKLDRWQITSNVAPIYFSSISNGSPIDAEFAENKKTYDNNLSLGLGVNFAVNKKIKIRSGLNKLTLGYSTKDVIFQAGLSGKTITNISTSSNASSIIITNKNNYAQNLLTFEQSIDNFNEGQINQKIGYYELPLELSYALLDKKFGVNLIAGLSTLFLTENSISISSENISADLGKANNLNDVHFSSNFGVGFKYNFIKGFEAKLEPTFKYQINTFSNNVGGFKPYFIGLYSGVSFSF